MSGLDETTAVEHVSRGLAEKFPSVDPSMVRSVVNEVHSTFDGPVRDYIPLLVERASRERLSALASPSPRT